MLKKLCHAAAILLIACLTAPAIASTAGRSDMEAKAARFFHYREWASAGALYTVLIGDNPGETLFYGRAIVAAGMLGDSTQQMALTHTAMNAHIPVDSLFTSVERTSFSVGQTSLYEHYLLLTKAREPWLTRIVDGYLMRYYTYRRDPQGMIDYSLIMLSGNPSNESFLYTLAQGYLIAGRTDDAIATYLKIITLNPRAYEAMLYLANYYALRAESDPLARSEAISYFRMAQAEKATPFVEQALSRLEAL